MRKPTNAYTDPDFIRSLYENPNNPLLLEAMDSAQDGLNTGIQLVSDASLTVGIDLNPIRDREIILVDLEENQV